MAPPNTEDAELTYRSTTTTTTAVKTKSKIERNYVPPNFSIKEIRSVVPSHCFERSTLKSFGYLARDLIAIATAAYLASFIDVHLPYALRFIAWPLYWFWAGAFATGVWVIAHECGHRAFSPSRTINYTVGFILHSALLVPFHSWRITHSRHHKNTGHMARDEVFLPKTRSQLGLPPRDPNSDDDDDNNHVFADVPIVTLSNIVIQQLFGWPAYLIANKSGRSYDGRANHFSPKSPIFRPDQFMDIVISDIGLTVTFSLLIYFSNIFSFLTVVKFYVVPYVIVNHWLVMITYLQHTHPELPHYREGQWNFVRGAAATVDRHYGILDNIFHRISSTHVAHHYFSEMPHYHAEEATKHLAKLLGPYYYFDDTPIFKALWDSTRLCRFVEDEGDIIFYKH